MSKDEEVIGIEEVSSMMKMSRRSILNAIRKQGLPARKVGIRYLFYKKAVLDWLSPVISETGGVSGGGQVVSKEEYDELKNERDDMEDVYNELRRDFDGLVGHYNDFVLEVGRRFDKIEKKIRKIDE